MTVAAEPVADAAGVLLPAPVLAIRDLHLTFPGSPPVRALRGVSLTIAPGEVVGLVGESGSGKTVLGLAALGLLPPVRGMTVAGEVRLGELDMTTAPEAARRAKRGVYVGAVFQDPMAALNPSMQIGRQVSEAAGGADDEAVAALLADAGIPSALTRVRQYPHELSGGLRQRVMIAMAVARGPSLVVADEPTTALDVTVQAHVLRLLARLRERGMSVLLVTHDLGRRDDLRPHRRGLRRAHRRVRPHRPADRRPGPPVHPRPPRQPAADGRAPRSARLARRAHA